MNHLISVLIFLLVAVPAITRSDESTVSDARLASIATDKPGVVSINLCADQMILELADAGQIMSLTNLSQQPAASVHFEQASQYPVNKGSAEEVLALQPELVIAGQYSNSYTLRLLQAANVRVETLPIAYSIADVIENLERVAGWLGQDKRGQELTAGLRKRLKLLPSPQQQRPRAAIYDPNGYTVGKDTLRGHILELAGWHNVALDRGIDNYGSLPLETLLKLDPQILLASPYSQGTWSRAQALNAHPSLHMGGLQASVVQVPSSQTICGGPWSLDVIERLVELRLRSFSH